MGTIKICEKISKIAIYLVVFLVPIFFLPWTMNVLDFNKQALLGILVLIGLLSWLLKNLLSGKFEFNSTFLNIPIVILVLVLGLSTLFSLSSYGSFWGWPLNISAGFLTLLFFVFLYFLITNILTKKKDIFWLLFVLASSGFLVAVFGGLQLFGGFIFPWDFTKITSFNTIGTVSSLAIFLAILLPLTISLVFIAKKLIRLILIFFAIPMLIVLILINFWVAWAVLIAGTTIIFIFGMLNIKKIGRTDLILLPMTLLIIALFFVTFRIALPGLPLTPIEISLNQEAGINIAKETFGHYGISRDLLGTGPGTFAYNFTRFKPVDLNLTPFWNVRFDRGASEILDRLATTGILGILSLLTIFGMFFWLGIKSLKKKTMTLDDMVILGIFSSFVAVVLSQFLYPANLSLNLVFWLLIGSLAAIETPKMKSWVFRSGSFSTIIVPFIFILVFSFGLGIVFLGGQKYLAEMRYLQGLKSWQQNQSEEAINYFLEAINLNPNLDRNFRDISQLYLVKLNELLQRADLSPEEIAVQSQILIASSINSAKQATVLNPENVANWKILGFVYRNIEGAEDWAIKSYQRALELEPTNPYIFTEMGKIYLQKANLLIRQQPELEDEIAENLFKAREKLKRAIELKPDYAPAHFQMAMVYIREERIAEAIERLEATKLIAPFDIGLAFQLGVIYYIDEQFDKAKAEFERAVRLDENFSNARYFLGLIYDKKGNRNAAIEQFEKIERLNPDNVEVRKILANLRVGRPALEGIAPAPQLLIEEEPPERLD